VQVVVQDREGQSQVHRHRRLAGQQRLHAVLDLQVDVVHLVVEGDHPVGEGDVALLDRLQRPPQRAQREPPLVLEGRLQPVELILEGGPHPKRPVM
jgi:hypothetical protein